MSDLDIEPGTRSADELSEKLEDTGFGVVCLSSEAQRSPWVLFEVGAPSKSVDTERVVPYLVGVDRKELVGPLTQFQSTEADPDGTWRLAKAVNKAIGQDALPEQRLRRYFEAYWPALESSIAEALEDQATQEEAIVPNELLVDLLNALIDCFDLDGLKILFWDTGLPTEEVNWNQAMKSVAMDALEVARDGKFLHKLFEAALRERPGRSELLEALLARIPKDA